MTEEQRLPQALPCPFCGANDGLTMTDGSTYRWGYAYCSNCGASAGETRRAYPDDGKWYEDAIRQWNQRAASPRRQWIGLSDDDLEDLLGFHCDINGEMNEVDAKKFAADIEKRLKEKNA